MKRTDFGGGGGRPAETGTQFTMDTLAARLNISKRTLYEHFSSKEELVEDLLLAKARDWSDLHRAVLARMEICRQN